MLYHAGLRILSESASVRMPRLLTYQLRDWRLRAGAKTSRAPRWNFAEPWPGGTWRLKDIVEYQLIVFHSIVEHAARYRERYLRNFYQVGKNIVSRKDWPYAFVIPAEQKAAHHGAASRRS